MKLLAHIDGREHTFEIPANRDGASWECAVNGQTLRADVREVEAGSYSILIGSRSFEVTLENNGGHIYASVNGKRFPVEIRDPRRLAHSAGGFNVAGPQTITSPMPGKVVRLLVAEGDEVEAGCGLLIVEAMKMQNEIKSPKAGRVASIRVSEGAAVGGGEAMMVVE